MSTDFAVERYRKLAKILRVLSQVGYWGSALVVLILLPLAIYISTAQNIAFGWGTMEYFNLGLTDGVIRYNLSLAEQSTDPGVSRTVVAGILYSVVVYSAVYGLVLFFLSGVLKSVEKGTPFIRQNARRLTSIGIVFIVGSVFAGVTQAAAAYAIIQALDLAALSVNYSVNSNMILTGLLMLILSGVFRYGAYLQEEYDATL
ncbi:DUF2975 domain-containing protein [Dethiobacter alkaliphilus]|uniref:DUF2975 domain-containing protein n=1 Tax=Dethiobacter alkaliphilus AHT 1 TaxID=555088 RepID=C0GCK0_DETAL|nr:DUF2975 domain-containing protein [Dethiobacter alkaliphilus]EEG78935.1 hypothetical protein DealDRAFT_0209 [Dethiobacter alkaliphilus AHT 1]